MGFKFFEEYVANFRTLNPLRKKTISSIRYSIVSYRGKHMTTNDELVVINTGGLDSTRADKDKKKKHRQHQLGAFGFQ